MKTLTIPTVYHRFLEDCTYSDIVNGYFGGSNLIMSYLNDYTPRGVDRCLAEFLEEHAARLGAAAIEDLLTDPDYIIREMAIVFYDALSQLRQDDSDHVEYLLRHSNAYFEPWGDYFIYANADVACTYIIRASNDHEAFEWLVAEFEKAFEIDEADADEDTPCNNPMRI